MELRISARLDRGLAYGEACFETLRMVDGGVLGWDAHLQRLRNGLACFGLSLDAKDAAELFDCCREQAARTGNDALLRVTVSGGEAAWGLANPSVRPTAYIQAMPTPERRGPVSLHHVAWPFPLKPRPAKFTADYAETLRALAASQVKEPLFVHDGLLLAAATANVAIYRQGSWWTPACRDGIVPGIVRGFLLSAGVMAEAECPHSWLQDCEAMVLTNSGLLVRAVAAIDGRRLDAAHPAIDMLLDALRGQPGVPRGV